MESAQIYQKNGTISWFSLREFHLVPPCYQHGRCKIEHSARRCTTAGRLKSQKYFSARCWIIEKPAITFAAALIERGFRAQKDQVLISGRIAQLVQSTCLTSRGSEVRILLRPRSHLTRVAFCFFRGGVEVIAIN